VESIFDINDDDNLKSELLLKILDSREPKIKR
jgi:hypothetical protein